jgi:hypothetical protein
MKNNSQFVTKNSVKAQLNSPLVMRKNSAALFNERMEPVETAKARINRKTTEIAGIFPYLFSLASYFFETFPGKIIRGEAGSLYYQIGTKDDLIPAQAFIALGIGDNTDQKNIFLRELYKLWDEKRYYWLPTGNRGDMIFMPPIQVFPVMNNEITDPEELKRLSQLGIDHVIKGFTMQCYKTLFDGHLNGYKDGFIKQPAAWYAKIRNSVNGMLENKAKFFGIIESGAGAETQSDMTALNVMKIWEYLSLHDNGRGKTKNVDVIDMLSHVAPSYLQKGEYLRHECIGRLVNALIALAKLTCEYRNELDFEIVNIELNPFDRAYARNHGHREGSALFMVEAVKHRLKSHKNVLSLQISREKERGHDGR